MADYRLVGDAVIRLADNASIPADPGNSDWQKYQAWLAAGGVPETPDLPPRTVRKSLIIQRLHDAGKLAAASAALNSDVYARERWYAPDQPAVHADNEEVVALLKAIGADATAILAPE